ISIIIPVYYNEGALLPLYEDMKKKALQPILDGGDDYEIIMVDDGSKDNSWNEMNQVFEQDERVHLYHLSRNFGEHPAILCGYAHCTGDCAINKAADLQEDSTLILEMFQKWKDGNNVVLAVREKREEGATQQFFANFYYWCARKLAFPQMPKGGFNIFLLDRRAITVLLNMDETNIAIEGQILWLGFKTATVPYIRKAREIGSSKWTLKKKVKCFMDMMFSNSNFPIHFVAGVGVFACVISVALIIYSLVNWLVIGEEVVGWTSLFITILFAFGIIMMTLAILGDYIWRCFDSVKRKPVFIVEKQREHNKDYN
ncbi:MAG: glycosyltransferase family 2 protein, partial [Lachnospiraceae bacterium]|nr:glycosyltransferase family 2 protein [Lachnospiraceae bacterium]